VLRDFAALRAAQGNASGAAALRKMAAGISKDTMQKMYQVTEGNGHFNVIFPNPQNSTGVGPATSLMAYEMRHVVDFFSVTFGLCGIAESEATPCDFTPLQRKQLGSWFRQESVTKTWCVSPALGRC